MNSVIERGYGIVICDGHNKITNPDIINFIDDLAQAVDTDNEFDITWSIDDKLDFIIDVYGEDCGLEFSYSGISSYRPCFYGVSLKSWNVWELMGKDNLIEWSQKINPTTDEINEYNNIDIKFRNLLLKHNLKPELFWLDTTS